MFNFNFYVEQSGTSLVAIYSSLAMAIIGWGVAIFLAIFGYRSNRNINETNRIFAAKKDTYDAVLFFVYDAQFPSRQINTQQLDFFSAKLDLFAPPKISEAFDELKESWQENANFGTAPEEKIIEFKNLLKEDLGIKEIS